MKKMLNSWFTDKNAPKEEDLSDDEIFLDRSTDRMSDLQEALISANQAFKEKEELFKEKEKAFIEKERAIAEKEEHFKGKEESLLAREKLILDKETRIAERVKSRNEKEQRLDELQKHLNERQISIEQKFIKPDEPEVIKPEIISSEKEIPVEVLARLEKIESALKESSHKDKIIRELHDDLQKKNRNFYSELTRPVIKSIIRIYDFVRGTLKLSNPKEGEDVDSAFKRLIQAVEGNLQMIEDLLNDEFNIEMFTPEKGDTYLPKEHTAIISIDTEDPALAGTIQDCRQAGFREIETGRIVKSAIVSVYKMKRK